METIQQPDALLPLKQHIMLYITILSSLYEGITKVKMTSFEKQVRFDLRSGGKYDQILTDLSAKYKTPLALPLSPEAQLVTGIGSSLMHEIISAKMEKQFEEKEKKRCFVLFDGLLPVVILMWSKSQSGNPNCGKKVAVASAGLEF
ncbi:hypothetical protein HK104_005937 [Borealophlyctis nickersoniae]|nr:hypothetical protein HK104_005937 [Borealophlyctis nickersoniae]